MDGDRDLDAMLARLRGLGKSLPLEAARRAAPLVEAAVKKTAAAGTSPDGKPWPERKKGGRALEHAADHVTAKAVGSSVVVTLAGPDVIHNYGTTRLPKRQVLPDAGAGVPPTIAAALKRGAADAFRSLMGGAS